VGNSSFRAARVIVETIDERDDRYVSFNAKSYRGKLHLIPKGPNAFIVVNYVNIEDYLAGVLPKELYPSWHIEAYRSLAVAGRTFALYHMFNTGQSKDYDLGDTVAAQVYGGRSAETPTSRQAVATTPGWTLTVRQNGRNCIFMPQYSSCCGGWVNAAIVLRDAPPIEPLRGGQRDLHCTASTKYRWPPVQVSKTELYTLLCQPSVRQIAGWIGYDTSNAPVGTRTPSLGRCGGHKRKESATPSGKNPPGADLRRKSGGQETLFDELSDR